MKKNKKITLAVLATSAIFLIGCEGIPKKSYLPSTLKTTTDLAGTLYEGYAKNNVDMFANSFNENLTQGAVIKNGSFMMNFPIISNDGKCLIGDISIYQEKLHFCVQENGSLKRIVVWNDVNKPSYERIVSRVK